MNDPSDHLHRSANIQRSINASDSRGFSHAQDTDDVCSDW
jgi:hypothetical protein